MLSEQSKKQLAVVLSQMDCSVQRMFPVTTDTSGMYKQMLESVPEKYRSELGVAYMALQNALFTKLAHNVRTVFQVNPNDELLGIDSPKALELATVFMEGEMQKQDAEMLGETNEQSQ